MLIFEKGEGASKSETVLTLAGGRGMGNRAVCVCCQGAVF